MEEKNMELSHNEITQLEDKIRKMINELSNAIYIAPLVVKYKGGIWSLKVGLNGKEVSQLSLGFQGSAEEFLNFLKKEFQKRQLQRVSSNSVTLINGDAPMHYPIIEL